jgi:hypothetical protein
VVGRWSRCGACELDLARSAHRRTAASEASERTPYTELLEQNEMPESGSDFESESESESEREREDEDNDDETAVGRKVQKWISRRWPRCDANQVLMCQKSQLTERMRLGKQAERREKERERERRRIRKRRERRKRSRSSVCFLALRDDISAPDARKSHNRRFGKWQWLRCLGDSNRLVPAVRHGFECEPATVHPNPYRRRYRKRSKCCRSRSRRACGQNRPEMKPSSNRQKETNECN